MSALSCCVTCGMTFHAWVRCSAVLRRMLLQGLRSTSPHFEKSGSACDGEAAPDERRRGAATGHHLPHEPLHVVDGDASAGTGCRSPGGCRRPARARCGAPTARRPPGRLRWSPAAARGLATRLMSTTSPRFCRGDSTLGVAAPARPPPARLPSARALSRGSGLAIGCGLLAESTFFGGALGLRLRPGRGRRAFDAAPPSSTMRMA